MYMSGPRGPPKVPSSATLPSAGQDGGQTSRETRSTTKKRTLYLYIFTSTFQCSNSRSRSICERLSLYQLSISPNSGSSNPKGQRGLEQPIVNKFVCKPPANAAELCGGSQDVVARVAGESLRVPRHKHTHTHTDTQLSRRLSRELNSPKFPARDAGRRENALWSAEPEARAALDRERFLARDGPAPSLY